MGSEHVRTFAHHSPPRLLLIAMVTVFSTFSAAFSCLLCLSRGLHGSFTLTVSTCDFLTVISKPYYSAYSLSFNSLLSCIRPQRLYTQALRPSLLDRAELCRQFNTQSHFHCSRSQGLPQNLDTFLHFSYRYAYYIRVCRNYHNTALLYDLYFNYNHLYIFLLLIVHLSPYHSITHLRFIY